MPRDAERKAETPDLDKPDSPDQSGADVEHYFPPRLPVK
jgi:hypothetical protein